jgi:hypothetical protein
VQVQPQTVHAHGQPNQQSWQEQQLWYEDEFLKLLEPDE